jgi:flagellar motility protein MotE (MotC chaperone)
MAPMAAPVPAVQQPVLYNVDAYTGLGILNSMINSKMGAFMKSVTTDINSFISSLITINQNVNQEIDKKNKEIADLQVEIATLNEKNTKLEEWKKTMMGLLKSDE